MENVLIISENKLKAFTALQQNVRSEDIAPYIIQAQDIYLQPVLGTRFFKRLKTGIVSGDLTPDEVEFIEEYVSPMLIQRAFALAIPFIKYKFADKGVLSGTSETATGVELDELKYLIQKVEDAAEFYATRVREFLFDNISLFQDYISPGIKGMLPDRSSQYTSGMVIPPIIGCGTLKRNVHYGKKAEDFWFWSGPVS